MAEHQAPKVIDEITSLKVSLSRAHRLIEHFCLTNPELYYSALKTFTLQPSPESIVKDEDELLNQHQGNKQLEKYSKDELVIPITTTTTIEDQAKEEKGETGEIIDLASLSAISAIDTFKEQLINNGRVSPAQEVVIPTALQPKTLIAVALATGKVSSVVSELFDSAIIGIVIQPTSPLFNILLTVNSFSLFSFLQT